MISIGVRGGGLALRKQPQHFPARNFINITLDSLITKVVYLSAFIRVWRVDGVVSKSFIASSLYLPSVVL